MNKTILTVIIASFLSSCAKEKYILDSYSTLRFENLTIPASASTKNLLTVDFISATQGYVGGTQGMLLTTADGGQSWQDKSRVSLGDVNKLLFLSAATGWAGTTTGLYQTSDGGGNWTKKSFYPINDVQFVTPQVGYAIGDKNVILRTNDAGTTWSEQHSTRWNPLVALRGVSFTSPDSGIVVGDEHATYQTTNGGRTWERNFYFSSLKSMTDVVRYRNGKTFVWVGESSYAGYNTTGFQEVFPVPGSTTSQGWTVHKPYPANAFTIYGIAQWQGTVIAVGESSVIRKHVQYASFDSPWVPVLGPDGTTIRHNYRAADFSDAQTFFAVGEKGVVSRFHYSN